MFEGGGRLSFNDHKSYGQILSGNEHQYYWLKTIDI